MKKSFKGLFAASLAVVALGGLVACGGDEEEVKTTAPVTTETAKPTVVEKDIKFAGKNTINLFVLGEDGKPVMGQFGPKTEPLAVDCELAGTAKDHKFTLTLKSAEKVEYTYRGTYEFADGVGYKFDFEGTNIPVRSEFDPKTKTHTIVVNAKFGRRGSSPVTLTLKDEKFVISEEKLFITNTKFAGQFFPEGGIEINGKKETGVGFGLKLYANGVCAFNNNHISELDQEGTFTFENDVFTINLKDTDGSKVVGTSVNNKGIYTIELTFHYNKQEVKVNMIYNSNYYGGHGLSTVAYPMGAAFEIVLTLNADGTGLFDGSAEDPLKAALGGMPLNTMYDRKCNWTYDATANEFTITYQEPVMSGQKPTGEMETKTVKATYNAEKQQYECPVSIGVAQGTLVGKDFGKDFKIPSGN